MYRIKHRVTGNAVRCAAGVLFLGFLVFAVIVTGQPDVGEKTTGTGEEALRSWSEGLGDAEYGKLAFCFKVTFMRIDVADIEALVTANVAGELGEVVRDGKPKRPRIERAAEVMLASDTIAFRFIVLRDSGIDRFLKGMRKNLEAALKAGVITEPEYERVWGGFQVDMTAMEERGSRKGDQMLYRVQNSSARLVYLGVDGDILVDATHPEEEWARGIKGLFLADDTSFRDKLIRSLWKDR